VRTQAYRVLLSNASDRDIWAARGQMMLLDLLLGDVIERDILASAVAGLDTPSDNDAHYDPMGYEEPEGSPPSGAHSVPGEA
jgi:hypothetical protein